jgi:hypothetical protein
MNDLWPVFGRICLDPDFHQLVFSVAMVDGKFEQLTNLETLLRITNNLCLGRWDIVEVNRCVTENFHGPNRILVGAPQQDQFVTAIRVGLPNPNPLPFPTNQHFCTVVGLACVDRPFRQMILSMATAHRPPADLVTELSQPTAMHPAMPLTAAEAAAVLDLIGTKDAQISAFHEAKWIVPDSIACAVGYSPDVAYMHASQTGAIAYLIRNPDKFPELFGNHIVQGSQTQELFSQLHERFLPNV